jgi:hypothetical protein
MVCAWKTRFSVLRRVMAHIIGDFDFSELNRLKTDQTLRRPHPDQHHFLAYKSTIHAIRDASTDKITPPTLVAVTPLHLWCGSHVPFAHALVLRHIGDI